MQIGGSLGQGLLSPIQTVETRTADPWGLDQVPRAAHLGPLVLGWWFHWGVKKWDNCFVYRERELNRFQLENLPLASNREDVWSTGVLAHQKGS